MPSNTELAALVDKLSRRIDDLTEKVNWGDIEHRIIISGDGPDEAKVVCRCGWTRNYFYPFSGNKYKQFPMLADKARADHKAEHDAAKAPKVSHVFTRTISRKEEPCGNVTGSVRTDCSCGHGFMKTTFGYRADLRKEVVMFEDAEKRIEGYEESHTTMADILARVHA